MAALKDRLKSERSAHNLTQEEVSKKINKSRATYARYETGEREPDIETLKQLADVFKTSVDYLIGRF
jgi:transcriptional regulator with XRE-family HTH domain